MRKRNGLPELQIWGGSSNAIFSKCKDTTSIAISKINLKKMNIEQFQQLLNEKRAEIEQALRRTLPIKVGRIAKDHFQEGFRQGGLTGQRHTGVATEETPRQIRTAHVLTTEPLRIHILPPRRLPRHRRNISSLRRDTQRGRDCDKQKNRGE